MILGLLSKKPLPMAHVARILHEHGAGSTARVENSLIVLGEMDLIREGANGYIVQPTGLALEDDLAGFRGAVTRHYCQLLSRSSTGSLFQRDPATDFILVDSMLLPYREHGLPFLLLDLAIMHRYEGRAWKVADDLSPFFLSMLRENNARATRAKPMLPAELDAWLAARRAAGLLAEAFALAFERRRLDGHPLLEQVRWIADEDVGAGYDIKTFDDMRSLALDRHIEVKGHAGDRSFHWSAGEMAAAQEKRQTYWLYLVDRQRIDEPGYEPEMYSDPYAYFIEDNPAGWKSEPTSYKFVAPNSGAGEGSAPARRPT